MAIIKRFTEKQIYAGGKLATNYLFADRNGRGILITSYSDHLTHKYMDDGLLTTTKDLRSEVATKNFNSYGKKIDIQWMNKVSRTPEICHPKNISSFTVEIPKKHTEFLTCAWISLGRARNSVYIPIYMGTDETPIPLADGTVCQLNQSMKDNTDIQKNIEEIEEELFRLSRQIEKEVKALLEKEDIQKAQDLIANANNICVSKAMEMLKKLEK